MASLWRVVVRNWKLGEVRLGQFGNWGPGLREQIAQNQSMTSIISWPQKTPNQPHDINDHIIGGNQRSKGLLKQE